MSESATKEQIIALHAQVLAYMTVLSTLIGELTERNILPIQERQVLFAKAEHLLSQQEAKSEAEDAIYQLALKAIHRLAVVDIDGRIQPPAQ